MEAKKKRSSSVTQDEVELIEQWRKHPQILSRVQKIMEIAEDDYPQKSVDQIEELLIEEMRRLGSATMHEWAAQAEENAGQNLQKQNPSALKRKKTLSWWCVFWPDQGAGTDLDQSDAKLHSPVAGPFWDHSARLLPANAASADGLWLRALVSAGGAKRARALRN